MYPIPSIRIGSISAPYKPQPLSARSKVLNLQRSRRQDHGPQPHSLTALRNRIAEPHCGQAAEADTDTDTDTDTDIGSIRRPFRAAT